MPAAFAAARRYSIPFEPEPQHNPDRPFLATDDPYWLT